MGLKGWHNLLPQGLVGTVKNLNACALSHFSCVQLLVTLPTKTCQASLSMGFSRQEYWNGLPCPPPGPLPNPGIKLTSLTSPALAGGFFTTSATWEEALPEWGVSKRVSVWERLSAFRFKSIIWLLWNKVKGDQCISQKTDDGGSTDWRTGHEDREADFIYDMV